VIKKESRGGLTGHFLPDLFLLSGPFSRERQIAAHLKESGLAPAIMERQFARKGPLSAVFTLVEYSEGARSLADLWRAERLDASALTAAGLGVGRLHRAGVLHGDLNAGNVLITPAGEALFLDLRHSKQSMRLPSASSRRRNLLRLARSLYKVRHTLDLRWPQDVWANLGAGYAEGWGEREAWLEGWALRCERGFPVRQLFWSGFSAS
jgi:tRNA A-37 threonylcarbamoyl transferase component Bud32